MTKDHNFFKNKKTKNSKSHAHLPIMMKYLAKFQINSSKDVAGVAGTRYESAKGHNVVNNGQNKNQKPHIYLVLMRRQSIKLQISPMKDVRRVAGTRSDGQNDGRKDRRME